VTSSTDRCFKSKVWDLTWPEPKTEALGAKVKVRDQKSRTGAFKLRLGTGPKISFKLRTGALKVRFGT